MRYKFPCQLGNLISPHLNSGVSDVQILYNKVNTYMNQGQFRIIFTT